MSGFPTGTADELELFLRWLAFLRGAVLRKASGLTDEQARWQPDGKLIPLQSVANIRETVGPLSVAHLGQMPAVTLTFNLAPGVSLSQLTATPSPTRISDPIEPDVSSTNTSSLGVISAGAGCCSTKDFVSSVLSARSSFVMQLTHQFAVKSISTVFPSPRSSLTRAVENGSHASLCVGSTVSW